MEKKRTSHWPRQIVKKKSSTDEANESNEVIRNVLEIKRYFDQQQKWEEVRRAKRKE